MKPTRVCRNRTVASLCLKTLEKCNRDYDGEPNNESCPDYEEARFEVMVRPETRIERWFVRYPDWGFTNE